MGKRWVAILLCCTGPGCGDSTSPDAASFRFQATATGSEIVVQISSSAIRDTALVLQQSQNERWVTGTIRRGAAGINPPWGWHLDPATISFPEVTIEACQATPEYIQETLDYWIDFGQVCILGRVMVPLE